MKTLREIRLQRMVQQAELAEAVGVTQSAISQVETGTLIPNDILKQKIEEYFGEKIDWERMTMEWRTKYDEGRRKPKTVRVKKPKN